MCNIGTFPFFNLSAHLCQSSHHFKHQGSQLFCADTYLPLWHKQQAVCSWKEGRKASGTISRSPRCLASLRRSQIISSRSKRKTYPAETHAASAALYKAPFHPHPSFEMLREAQQEEASRLGSKSSFDASPLFPSPFFSPFSVRVRTSIFIKRPIAIQHSGWICHSSLL